MPEFKLSIGGGLSDQEALDQVHEALDLLDVPWALTTDEPHIDPTWYEIPPTGSQRQAVLLALVEADRTRDEVSALLRIPDSAVDGRVIELRHGGWIVGTDEKRITRAGKPAEVLTITDKARIKVNLKPVTWFPGKKRVERKEEAAA